MISQDMEETYEMKRGEFKELEKYVEKKQKEVEEICKRNHVTLEEVKEISKLLNYYVLQMIIDNEEHLGTNSIVPMNIRNSVKMKKKKKEKKNVALKKEKEIYMKQ
jgi:hypothetical protein